MASVPEPLTASDLEGISNLQILARQVVEGFCSGFHRSRHKGVSVEFKQHRPYVSGDEIRHIDWRVFGRSDHFYVREYEEETALRATLLVDLSGSMSYGRRGVTKAQYATRLAACLGYLMLKQKDSVGLVTFDSAVRRYLPPRARAGHLRLIFEELERSRPGGETELGAVFHELAPKLSQRGLLVVLSDCFCDVPALLKSLAHFRHAHHEILILQIWDPDELEFPFKEWTRFECAERKGVGQLVDPVQLSRVYLENVARFRQELTVGCRKHRVDLVSFTTEQPYAEALAAYLNRRLVSP
jgi:uncharacterized protein (DUF58 family)